MYCYPSRSFGWANVATPALGSESRKSLAGLWSALPCRWRRRVFIILLPHCRSSSPERDHPRLHWPTDADVSVAQRGQPGPREPDSAPAQEDADVLQPGRIHRRDAISDAYANTRVSARYCRIVNPESDRLTAAPSISIGQGQHLPYQDRHTPSPVHQTPPPSTLLRWCIIRKRPSMPRMRFVK